MTNHPILPQPGRAVRDALRDDLIDLLRTRTRRQVIAAKATSLRDYREEADPFLRRRKWSLSRVHTAAELRRSIAEFVAGLEPLPEAAEPDALTGAETDWHTASFWEAVGGINYVGSAGGGVSSLSAEDIDWGDLIGDSEFSSQENAQEFADTLDAAGIPNTGPVQGPDGTWTVHFVLASSD